ncbi:class I SAM-dependent methyltransferase [Sinomicrobium oceani]|uniref:class I SAM-dependent methyltransferase n=1 Tax=Sinomicrobium oceani TaxID=1150368 RepID=UPI00227CC91C|nr:class I SAM-dependent methyltransferase [Sinomicrobium oceani]
MTEFWELSFRNNKAMWGEEPADVTKNIVKLFRDHDLKNILIPGFGYGRNARVFTEQGFDVTGIEISKTAIAMAGEYCGHDVNVFHGPVSDMPFDEEMYDGIFCYALVHLLSDEDRLKFIRDCYEQLQPGGVMVFVTLSVNDARYGKGILLSENRFRSNHGVELFFYDSAVISKEFTAYGLVGMQEISEPENPIPGKPSQKFWTIVCEK